MSEGGLFSRHRRLWLSLLVVVALVALAGGALWARSSSLFFVRQVVVPATKSVTEEQLRQALRPAEGQNLFALSTAALEARLAAIPYVQEAHVYRRFPDALEVEVKEYTAVAQVRGREGRRWLVAADGRVLRRAERESPEILFEPRAETWPRPGAHIPTLVVKALAVAPLLADPLYWPADVRVGAVRVKADGTCDMVLDSGTVVRLGDPLLLEQKLMAASRFIDPKSNLYRRYRYVDVSTKDYVVVPKTGS